jgi:F-type H+-transporting ATPase subunit gamma
MADDLAAVRARIHGVEQLGTVIGAMRGIAAAHAQQSRGLLPGFRAYAEVIARAISSALRLRDGPPPVRASSNRGARVVFSAEQGFIGGFVEHVLDELLSRNPADLLLVGSRGLSLASVRGVSPVWQSAMATHVDGIAAVCIRIADALYDIIGERQISRVEVVFPVWTHGGGLGVMCHSLLPLDEPRFRTTPAALTPLSTLPPDVLLSSLAEEYVYATLCEAAMCAFVAENEARASAMARARAKLQDILTELHLSEHRVRQEAITAELVELAASRLAREPSSQLPG